jgi:hypothetical protein
METLNIPHGTPALALEAVIGFVMGACIVRAMPRVIPSRWMIGLGIAGIGLVAIAGAFVYPFHERMLVLVAIFASYVVSAAALRTEEVRSRHSADELILLGLALLSVATAGALLGYSLLAILAGLGSLTILVLAFAGAVMLATGFGLVVLFMDRGGARKVNWRATIAAASRLVEGSTRKGTRP